MVFYRNGVVFMCTANLLKLATYPSAGMVLVIGLVVVFAVLLLLTFVFWLFGKIVGGGNENPSAPAIPKPVKKAPAPVPQPVTDGVPDEVVAVIAAAVAAMSDGTTQYAIRRIRPASVGATRSAWAAAGLADNTRPF